MNQFQKHANALVKAHTLERALEISESCLVAVRNAPNTYLFDEAAFYLDKDGSLQLAKDQKKFASLREKRLSNTRNFWLQVTAILKKQAKGVSSEVSK